MLHQVQLTKQQRRMYRLERSINFRLIYQLLAKKSKHILTAHDLASAELHAEISTWGQWAELAYVRSMPLNFIFENLEVLSQPHFPLEGYDAFTGAKLIGSFKGHVADVKGFVAYSPNAKQLICSITGTHTFSQAIYDLRYFKHTHRDGDQGTYKVHTGFWKMYKGIRSAAKDTLQNGLQEDVQELIMTGHSMSAAMIYFLTVDLLKSKEILKGNISLKLVLFGSPKVGNQAFVDFWHKLVDNHRAQYGTDSLVEYSVKAYNDGVPLLPPYAFHYKSCAKRPLYFYNGRIFHIPESENEFALFDVAINNEGIPDWSYPYPKGGHNYYNRDLEKLVRRMDLLKEEKEKRDSESWTSSYQARVLRREGLC